MDEIPGLPMSKIQQKSLMSPNKWHELLVCACCKCSAQEIFKRWLRNTHASESSGSSSSYSAAITISTSRGPFSSNHGELDCKLQLRLILYECASHLIKQKDNAYSRYKDVN